MEDMYVCLCADMTESQILDAILNDPEIDTIEDLAYMTGVCCGCQTCLPKVEEILGEAKVAYRNNL